MTKNTRILFELIIAGTLPIFFFLLFWWGSLFITPNVHIIALCSLTGLGLGIVLAAIAKWRWKTDVFTLPRWALVVIYIFYSICVLGFFMGVPIFHPVLGLLAGAYWANRMTGQQIPPEDYPRTIRKVALFTALVMAGICLASAAIALIDDYTASNLQGMFRLPFDVTQFMVVALIVLGGIFLIVLQYWLTRMIMKKVLAK